MRLPAFASVRQACENPLESCNAMQYAMLDHAVSVLFFLSNWLIKRVSSQATGFSTLYRALVSPEWESIRAG